MKRICYSWLFLCMLFTACVNEDHVNTYIPPAGEGELPVTFSIYLPAQAKSSTTYAMDDAAENYLRTIDVLAFRKDDDGKEYFMYKARASEIDQNDGSRTKKFTVTVFKKDFRQRFVIIANAQDQIDALGEIDKDEIKEDILENLIFENQGPWDATSNVVFTPIPMWGESDFETVDDNTTIIGDISVLRMVARMDVLLDPEMEGNFKLTSVALYNRKTRGHVVPVTEPTYWNASDKKVIKPTMPAEGSSLPDLNILGPYRYTKPTTPDSAFVQTIYTFEAEAVNNGNTSDATCLVIGGIYDIDTDTTYYRIDFLERNENGEMKNYKNILRNHLYRVNIVGVKGSGYEEEEDAFNSISVNMEVEVKEWDCGEMGNIVFDGHYLLSVSPENYKLPRDERDSIPVKIYTDWPGGWKAKAAQGTWMHVFSPDPLAGPADQTVTAYFSVDENDTGSERRDTIKITAGRLTYDLIVIQTIDADAFLTVTNAAGEEVTELVFPSAAGLPYAEILQQLNVSWAPAGIPCMVNATMVTGYPQFEYDNGSDPLVSSPLQNGSQSLNIQAKEMTATELAENIFKEKVTKLEFTVNNGSSFITKVVYVRQINYAVVAEVEDSYMMDGSVITFTVKSNAMWNADITPGNNNDLLITPNTHTTQGGHAINGEPFTFTILNTDVLSEAVSSFTFSSPEGKFFDTEVDIIGKNGFGDKVDVVDDANSFIVLPGYAVLFPVTRINEFAPGTLGDDEDFDVEIIWIDDNGGLSASGVIESFSVYGTGIGAEILVNAGSKQGNALIAAKKKGTGEIMWSWHIWVVDYEPGDLSVFQGYTFMDRDLGAVTTDEDFTGNVGLAYQWGRKDPFPGAQNVNTPSFRPLYKVNGQPHTTTYEAVHVNTDISLTVKNPTKMYLGTSANSYDWYASGWNDRNNMLWGASDNDGDGFGSKSIYDPCPYRWRVQPGGSNANPYYQLTNSQYTNDAVGKYTDIPAIGTFPWAGFIVPNTGTPVLTYVGTQGHYWSMHGNGSAEGRGIKFSTNEREASAVNSKSHGKYIRCVRDNF